MRREDTLVLRADLPGLKPHEIKIEVEDGIPTVSGEHQEDRTDVDAGRYVLRERRFGAFSRSVALPSGVDAQAIKAQTRDGVVEVTFHCPVTPRRRRSR
jgi:HSP20 family protein